MEVYDEFPESAVAEADVRVGDNVRFERKTPSPAVAPQPAPDTVTEVEAVDDPIGGDLPSNSESFSERPDSIGSVLASSLQTLSERQGGEDG